MRTIDSAVRHSGISADLVRAVIEQVGGNPEEIDDDTESTLRDAMNHGASGGFAGFTYYKDSVAFFESNRDAIHEMTRNMARDMGEGSAVSLVMGFNCLKQYKNDPDLEESAGRCLYGAKVRDDGDNLDITVANALAWFALEEVARALCDE